MPLTMNSAGEDTDNCRNICASAAKEEREYRCFNAAPSEPSAIKNHILKTLISGSFMAGRPMPVNMGEKAVQSMDW